MSQTIRFWHLCGWGDEVAPEQKVVGLIPAPCMSVSLSNKLNNRAFSHFNSSLSLKSFPTMKYVIEQNPYCWRIRRQSIKHLPSSIKPTLVLYLGHRTAVFEKIGMDHRRQFNNKHCRQASLVKALFNSHYHVTRGLLPDNSQRQPCVITTLHPAWGVAAL